MTQISGQIYQMTNGKTGAALVNRFPRTVMEAVYGLNTYLQNQFSALADIYMPIEGITESKPLQEFVYRLCPSSIKAKSVSLDRIYGKTLAWNQLVQNGNFENGTDNWYNTYGSITFSVDHIVANVGSYQGVYSGGMNIIAGHKYYCSIRGTSESDNNIHIAVYSTSLGRDLVFKNSVGENKLKQIKTAEATGEYDVRIEGIESPLTVNVFYANIIDLTLMFGSGNEPSTVEEFESMFPGYHEAGNKLISNDAESIETVGFNQWDEEAEAGYFYQDSNGGISYGGDGSTSTLRSKNFIPVLPDTDYHIHTGTGYVTRVAYFDFNKNYLYIDSFGTGEINIHTPENVAFIKFHTDNYGIPYNHDVCINLSDPAKNGTYEPYRKSTMRLNLGSFQVRDSQGNVTTIEGGLKSAGNVRDEIVGNKYIKRVGSVDLGTLTWQSEWYTSGEGYRLFYFNYPGKKTGITNIVCSKYPVNSSGENALKNNFGICGRLVDGTICIGDNRGLTFEQVVAELSGVYLDYELATPVEYELVSPLVPTVKAGETEARISPNADGLSAPMVADMTYDAQANNDSASAQYALTAGRLLNSHKLWGQDFDGTQDVSGALTGVTSITMNGALSGVTSVGMSGAGTVTGVKSIDSLLYFDTTNSRVGIGKTTPSYALDVIGTINADNSLRASDGTGTIRIGYWDSYNTRIENTGKPLLLTSYSQPIKFGFSGDGNALYIKTNSYVGINNIDPQYRLDVSGTFRATGAATLGSTLTVTGLTSIAGGLKLTTTKKIWFDDTHYLELLTENGTQYLHTNLTVVSDAGVVAGAAANS